MFNHISYIICLYYSLQISKKCEKIWALDKEGVNEQSFSILVYQNLPKLVNLIMGFKFSIFTYTLKISCLRDPKQSICACTLPQASGGCSPSDSEGTEYVPL